MNDTLLFDSLTSPIPGIRPDLNIIPIKDDGRDLLYFHDVMGYASPNFALDSQVETVLSLINNRTSVKEICKLSNGNISTDELLEFIQLLDQNRILFTKHFKLFSNKIEKQFEKGSVRNPVLAGRSYPENSDQLDEYMTTLFENTKPSLLHDAKALYAPHIELSVGQHQYAEAFSHLGSLKPKRVVILATSHYAGYFPDIYDGKPFIATNKDFKLPHRLIETDRDYINRLSNSDSDIGITLTDRAHRIEHSIETHLLFASHFWKHDFQIVPILIGSFDEILYHNSGDLAGKIDRFTDQLKTLDDEGTFYLISGDLSHVGKKFGDRTNADLMRDKVQSIDTNFLDASVNMKSDQLLKNIASHYDSSRICGFPPLYTFINAFGNLNGEQINYHWWDDTSTESAVSFGSIIYR
ncbi:AmmeMemoRadiSam system protein B [Rhodohalobacter sp.]|uniref:AmmeMemoRadiSam system protein B n=1 Tax=Rhodohalobacter sp. TaxID=1974210 RepID=UPI002ACE2B98|nr:AmmeMemoRadiSam system protein B [Rhodohalobacter sp.]MDZ7755452.1 AmmeMemoRadiSam system protein B [Rhodohalobacter sp.]